MEKNKCLQCDQLSIDNKQLVTTNQRNSNHVKKLTKQLKKLSKLLSKREKISTLKNYLDSKKGLGGDTLPLYDPTHEIDKTACWVVQKSALNTQIVAFQNTLESFDIGASSSMLQEEIFNQVKAFDEQGYKARTFIRNKKQAKIWRLLFRENDKELLIQNISFSMQIIDEILFRHEETLQSLKEFLKNEQEHEKPDVTRLIKDVDRFFKNLQGSVEKFSTKLDKDQQERFNQFQPALGQYYDNQINRLVGDENFVETSQNLHQIQARLNNARHFQTIYLASKKLNYSMQRLYLLHYIAEHLARKIVDGDKKNKKNIPFKAFKKFKYALSLGQSTPLIKKYMTPSYCNENIYENILNELIKAKNFRNDIAHQGVIWNPANFEEHILNYEQGINTLSKEFNVALKNMRVKSPFSLELLKKYTYLFEEYYPKGLDAQFIYDYAEPSYADFLRSFENLDEKAFKKLKTLEDVTMRGYFFKKMKETDFYFTLHAFNLFAFEKQLKVTLINPQEKNNYTKQAQYSYFTEFSKKFFLQYIAKDSTQFQQEELSFIDEFKIMLKDNEFRQRVKEIKKEQYTLRKANG